MAQQHLNTVLAEVGIDQTEIDSILAIADDAKDFDPKVVSGKIYTNAETKVKNDPKFWEGLDENNINEGLKKKIEAQQYGRAAGIARQKVLKTLGIKEEDLADLTEDEKGKYEIVIAKAAEKFASSKVTDKQLQEQLLTERKKLEDLEASIPEKESAIKTKLETEYSDRTLSLVVLSDLARIEGLKSPAKYILPELLNELKSTYAFEVNGLDAKPRQKDKPTLAIVEGSKELTLNDVINKILTRDGLIEDKKAGGKQTGKTTTVDVAPGENGKLAISSHIMDKINANMPKATA